MKLAPLVERLISQHGAAPVTLSTLPAWLATPGDQVLFFSGDPVRFPEVLDLAVVLPELQRAAGKRLGMGVVLREDEDAIARRFGVQRWPSLLFVRDGGYVTALAGMRDWEDYLRDLARALETPVTRAPTIGIPLVAATGESACH